MRLTEIRKSRGLKQNQVARDLGINIVTYNGYETGKSEPNIETIIKLAKYFNVTIDNLLGVEKVNNVILTERRLLIEKINDLTETECYTLKGYADALISQRAIQKEKIKKILLED